MDGSKTIRRQATTTIGSVEITEATLEAARSLGVEVAQMMIDDGADLLPPGPARGTR
jgi:hydroxymethylbilane synthase